MNPGVSLQPVSETQFLQYLHGARADAIAARLVAWEARLIDQRDISGAVHKQGDCEACTSGTRSRHRDREMRWPHATILNVNASIISKA